MISPVFLLAGFLGIFFSFLILDLFALFQALSFPWLLVGDCDYSLLLSDFIFLLAYLRLSTRVRGFPHHRRQVHLCQRSAIFMAEVIAVVACVAAGELHRPQFTLPLPRVSLTTVIPI